LRRRGTQRGNDPLRHDRAHIAMQPLEAVGWPPDYIALGLPSGVDAWRDRADGASNTAMRFENEMQPAALRHMALGDRDLMAVLVGVLTGGVVLQLDIT